MKELIVISEKNCPYCKKLKNMIERATLKDSRLKDLKIIYLTAEKAKTDGYKVLLYPSVYFNNKKVLEGNIKLKEILKIMVAAFEY